MNKALEEALQLLDKIAEIQKIGTVFHKNIDRWNKKAWDQVESCQSKIKACSSKLIRPVQKKMQKGMMLEAKKEKLLKKHKEDYCDQGQ